MTKTYSIEKEECSLEYCDRMGVARWKKQTDILCFTHYEQMNLRGYTSPIRERRLLHRDENGRVCTNCNTYKPWNEYYNGKAQCKRCHIEMVTKRKAARDAAIQ